MRKPPSIRLQPAVDRRLALEQIRDIAGGLADQADAQAAEPSVDAELGRGVGSPPHAALDAQAGLQLGRREARASRRNRSAACGAIFASQRRDRGELARVELDVHAAARRRKSRFDPAADVEGVAAQIGDRKPLDLQAVAIEPEPRMGVARL